MRPTSLAALASSSLVLFACQLTPDSAAPPPPASSLFEGPKVFYGETLDQNPFSTEGLSAAATGIPLVTGDDPFRVLVIPVDTNTRRHVAGPMALDAYLDARTAGITGPLGDYWDEASYGLFETAVEWSDDVEPLDGQYDDYYYRNFVRTSMKTVGLLGAPGGVTLTSGPNALLLIVGRQATALVQLFTEEVGGKTYPGLGPLRADWQAALDDQGASWVQCSIQSPGELVFRMDVDQVGEGTFIRVIGGKHDDLAAMGLAGPLAIPNSGGTLVGELRPNGFALFGDEEVEFQLRASSGLRRTITVDLGPLATSPGAFVDELVLENHIIGTLNAEHLWVLPYEALPDERLAFELASQSGGSAIPSIHVSGGVGLPMLGLAGPEYVDGETDVAGGGELRGDASFVVSEALGLYVERELLEQGIVPATLSEAQFQAEVDALLAGYAGVVVHFVEEGLEKGIGPRRRESLHHTTIDVVSGVNEAHRELAYSVGTGHDLRIAWIRGIGIQAGLRDLAWRAEHDLEPDDPRYVRGWGLMGDEDGVRAHPVGWQKWFAGWLDEVVDVAPPQGKVEQHSYVLAPQEYPLEDYAGVAVPHPLVHMVRLVLSEQRAVPIELRAKPAFFLNGPEGLLVTDTCGPDVECPGRPAVLVVDPDGLEPGDELLTTSPFLPEENVFVRYVGSIPGPEERPPLAEIEVQRGPGEFIDLAITPWDMQQDYATPDIWIDFPEEPENEPPFPGVPGLGGEPPFPGQPLIGNGDRPHWQEDGSVDNYVYVRVRNDGNAHATGVRVECFVAEYKVGGFEPLPVQAPPATVPRWGYFDFRFVWRPKKKGHYCLKANVVGWDDGLIDIDPGNHEGKENVVDFHPSPGSPYPPVDFEFSVKNDADQSTEFLLFPTGLRPGTRLEVDRTRLRLPPGGETAVKARLFLDIAKFPPTPKSQWRFNLNAWRRTSESWEPYGGVTYQVFPTLPSYMDPPEVSVRVSDTGQRTLLVRGVLGGPRPAHEDVDLSFVGADGVPRNKRTQTGVDGAYVVTIPDVAPGAGSLMVYYFGHQMSPAHVGSVPVAVP